MAMISTSYVHKIRGMIKVRYEFGEYAGEIHFETEIDKSYMIC
jgi:hypothetical protein